MFRLYTGGTYDLPHLGHCNFFRQCKELFPDSFLIVALNTDEFIEKFKGKKPLFSYDERKKLIETIEYVDLVTKNFGDEDSSKTIAYFRPNVVLIGNDWLEKDYCKQMSFDAEWLRRMEITLCYIPYTEGISTTLIKERMKNA